MRGLVLSLLVVSGVAAAQDGDSLNGGLNGPIYPWPALLAPTLDAYAYFEFAPTSGAGMTAECACTTPTGAKGETLTYTRTSTAACTKGHTTSGIDNGDVVLCTANQPRVMRGGDGTGTLGLLVESARTNVVLRSEEFDNASWTAVGTPTEAADSTTAPDGTTTADTVGDDDGAAYEGEQQTLATTATQPSVLSVYAKGLTATKVRLSNDGTTCDFDALSTTTWTRITCADTSASGASTVQQILVGGSEGVSATGTVYLWGAQFETGSGVTWASSYIPTTTAAAARGADAASFTLPASGALWPSSIAATVTADHAWVAGGQYVSLGGTGVTGYIRTSAATTAQCVYSDAANTPFAASTIAAGPGTALRSWCQSDPSLGAGSYITCSLFGVACGASGGGQMTTPRTVTSVSLSASPGDAVVSRVCYSPTAGGCR